MLQLRNKSVIFIGTLFFSGCIVFKKHTVATESKAGKLSNHKVFVVLDNGDTIKGKKWNIKNTKNGWNILLDGVSYPAYEVSAFQSKDGFARRFSSYYKNHSFIDMWAYYLRWGEINIVSHEDYDGQQYTSSRNPTTGILTSSNSAHYRLNLYYQIGNGDFIELNAQTLKTLISDNQAAVKVFNDNNIKESKVVVLDNSIFAKKVLRVIDVYNAN